jgi:hypothetical protein
VITPSTAAAARKIGADRGVDRAELVEPQRGDHVDRAGEGRRQRHQPDRDQDRSPEQVRGRDRARRGLHRDRRGERSPGGEAGGEHRHPGEHRPLPELDRRGSKHRPDEDASDRGRDRPSDQLAAPALGRDLDQPGEAARPGEGAADALEEAGDVEHRRVRGVTEDEARPSQEGEAGEEGGLDPDPRRQQPPGQRGDQGPGGVGGGEDAGGRLREAELVLVARMKTRRIPRC